MNETLTTSSDGLLTAVSKLSITVIVAAAVPLLFLALSYTVSPRLDPNEPPAIWPRFPLVGHIIGMIFDGFRYYKMPTEKLQAPIITLPILNGRMYVATGKDIISQIARNSKTLSFDPFVAPMAAKVCGANQHMIDVLNKNLTRDEGDFGYYINIVRRMRGLLSPGQNLVDMEKSIYKFMSQQILKMENGPESSTFKLFDKMRYLLNAGTFTTLYGASHPYNHASDFAEDVTAFENGLDGLMVGIVPKLTARKAYQARERMIKHLTHYYRDGLPDDASAVIRARYEEGIRFGLENAEIARFEIALIFAIVENSSPSAFWMMLHVWSAPGLVDRLRAELKALLRDSCPDHKPQDPLPAGFLLDLTRNAALLRSTFDEMLRVHSFSCSVRQVVEDTVLTGRERDYLVKKDNIILIPNAVLHSSAKSFPDPETFNPERFLASASKPAEHRPFGGGSTICPGRHFATSETLALAAMMVLNFDAVCIGNDDKQRDWWLPANHQHSQAAGIFPPKEDVRVKLVKRGEYNLDLDFE